MEEEGFKKIIGPRHYERQRETTKLQPVLEKDSGRSSRRSSTVDDFDPITAVATWIFVKVGASRLENTMK